MKPKIKGLKMKTKSVLLALLAVLCLMITLTACGESNTTDPEMIARERLLASGIGEEYLDVLIRDGISLSSYYNSSKFFQASQNLMIGEAIVPSGNTIDPNYMGGVYFDDDGILNVRVVAGAFDDPVSNQVIKEMQEMGINVYIAQFSWVETHATLDKLSDIHTLASEKGAVAWGEGLENGVVVWLYPYTPEQNDIFMTFLIEQNIDPDIVFILPGDSLAVDPEM